MNILHDNGIVTIIDWGATMIGCFAQDLGRWLGDLRHRDTSGWIPDHWIEPVLRAYCDKQSERLDEQWNTWKGIQDDFFTEGA